MNIVIGFLFSFFAIVASDGQYILQTKYIDVPIDHYSYVSNATFKLKYLINDSYHEQNGPIFFYTGNEGDINDFAQNTGFMFDIAPDFGALIVFAEHRYYGESLPFGKNSYDSPANLGYLSSSQALSDYVYLIDQLQNDYKHKRGYKKFPVIAFGGSYGGMLAAYIRMKYPASVLGAIASSAPIWQFQGLTPCENFNRITTYVYESFGKKKCTEVIKKSWKIIRTMGQTAAGKKNLTSMFNLCTDLTTDDDINTLVNWIAEIIVNMAMVNYPYSTSFLTDLPAFPVLEFCAKVNLSTWTDDTSLIKTLSDSLQIYTNYTQKTKCNSINVTSVDLGEKGWNFQSCTEMVMPFCSTDQDMFENDQWDFQKFSDECYKNFKVRPKSEYEAILMYGGKSIEAASNIVFSNGLLDPWSSGGVLGTINDRVKAIIIIDGAHHYDLRGQHEKDTESVKFARSFHSAEIKKWLKQYYNESPKVQII